MQHLRDSERGKNCAWRSFEVVVLKWMCFYGRLGRESLMLMGDRVESKGPVEDYRGLLPLGVVRVAGELEESEWWNDAKRRFPTWTCLFCSCWLLCCGLPMGM